MLLPACQLCPCHRTLVGSKPRKTDAASLQPASEGEMLRAGGWKRLFLPQLLKFAGSGPPCQGVRSNGSNARATAGQAGSGRLCCQYYTGGPWSGEILKSRRCTEGQRGWASVWAPSHTRFQPGWGALSGGRECVSSRRWQLREQPRA